MYVSAHEQFGLVLLGSCPGGAASNFWTAMFDGDVNLSVTMTLISSIASFGMTTLWVYLLGRHLVEGEGAKDPKKPIQIPYDKLALTLLGFAIPLLLGVLFKQKWKSLGERIHHYVAKPFFLVCLIFLGILGAWNTLFMWYLLNWRHILAGFLMGSFGYLFGALLAMVCNQKKPQVIAISLEAALQNFGISFVVLKLTFESPYSDLGVLPIIGYYLCSTTPVLLLIYLCYSVRKYWTGKVPFGQINNSVKDDT